MLLGPASALSVPQSLKLLVDVLHLWRDGRHNVSLALVRVLAPPHTPGPSASHLEINHVPEALQVSASGDLLTASELTVVHQTTELVEALLHQQPGLANGCAHAISHWTHKDTALNS